MQLAMHVYEVLLAIALAPSYIPRVAQALSGSVQRVVKVARVSDWRKTRSKRMISVMRSKHSFARNLLLGFCFVCAVCAGTVAQGGASYLRSNHHFAPGRLVIDRVPNFGWNLAFNLQIDGRPVANVVQGHSYSTWLPAGTYVLTVHKVPAVGYTEPTSTTVNIQPGTDHLYVAMWDSGLVYLHPAGVSVTPGSYWQFHGDGTP
jgi:hypothetical protein